MSVFPPLMNSIPKFFMLDIPRVADLLAEVSGKVPVMLCCARHETQLIRTFLWFQSKQPQWNHGFHSFDTQYCNFSPDSN